MTKRKVVWEVRIAEHKYLDRLKDMVAYRYEAVTISGDKLYGDWCKKREYAINNFLAFARKALKPGSWRIVK